MNKEVSELVLETDRFSLNKTNVPFIYQNSLFIKSDTSELIEHATNFRSYHYSRGNNPTVNMLEKELALLEHGEDAKCFGSGMAAISSAIMSVLSPGDHVICLQNLYSSTIDLLMNYLGDYGVETTILSLSDQTELEKHIKPHTKMIYLETASSFLFELVDLPLIAQIAKQNQIVTLIDNTWATPLFCNPIDYGIDLVLHSLSKYITGHSDVVGGAIIGSNVLIERIKKREAMLFGGRMSAFEAYLVLRGLRTLDIRMQTHFQSAMKIAKMLEKHPKVLAVVHPGLDSFPQKELAAKLLKGCPGLFGFILNTDFEGTKRFIDKLKYFQIGVSWGGFESLAIPYGAVLSDLYYDINGEFKDVSSSFVRLSIGLEDEDDLIEDLLNGLAAI